MKSYLSTILLPFLIWVVSPIIAQPESLNEHAASLSKEEQAMQELVIKSKRNLLVMLKVGQDLLAKAGPSLTTSSQARVLNDGTPIYSSRFDTTSLIEHADRNEMYDVLDQFPGYLHIKINAGAKGWIKETDVHLTNNQSNLTRTINTLSKGSSNQLELIHRLFHGMKEIEEEFDKIFGQINAPSVKMRSVQKEIKRYVANAFGFYTSNFRNLSIEETPYVKTFNRFSGQLQLGTGSSTFSDSYSASLQEQFKGSLKDISIQGSYQLDQKSALDLNFASRSEVLETPFKSKNYQFGYRRRSASTNFSAQAGLNQYRDDFRGLNNYDRASLNTALQHKINQKNTITVHYQFLHNSYQMDASSNYARHNLTATSEKRTKANNIFLLSLRGNASSSDRDHLNFTHVRPSIAFKKLGKRTSTDYTLSLEAFSYANLTLRNSTRTNFNVSHKRRKELGKTSKTDVQFSYIAYPSNPMIDHARVNIKTSKNNFVDGNTFSRFGITTRYFSENPQASFADLRYDAGVNGKLFTQLSFFNRTYYPDKTILTSTEANLKIGLQFGGFKMGPVISVRGTLDLNEIKLNSDGNYYRLGAFVQGSKTFKNGFRMALNGAYEYGHVFVEDLEIDPGSGLIDAGQVSSRTPTSLRFSSSVNYKIKNMFDLFANLDYYKIDQDHQSSTSLHPIQSSDRLSFKIGIIYRYN